MRAPQEDGAGKRVRNLPRGPKGGAQLEPLCPYRSRHELWPSEQGLTPERGKRSEEMRRMENRKSKAKTETGEDAQKRSQAVHKVWRPPRNQERRTRQRGSWVRRSMATLPALVEMRNQPGVSPQRESKAAPVQLCRARVNSRCTLWCAGQLALWWGGCPISSLFCFRGANAATKVNFKLPRGLLLSRVGKLPVIGSHTPHKPAPANKGCFVVVHIQGKDPRA